jgi:hypothetical protein
MNFLQESPGFPNPKTPIPTKKINSMLIDPKTCLNCQNYIIKRMDMLMQKPRKNFN